MLRDFTKDFRRKLADGKPTDEALAELRTSGASIMECIAAVKSFRRCELAEAKAIVHNSSAWADIREQNESFHAKLEEATGEGDENR
jgi:hypothetical protein